MIKYIKFGGQYEPSEIKEGGNGTSLTPFSPARLPLEISTREGGLRCEGEVTHRG